MSAFEDIQRLPEFQELTIEQKRYALSDALDYDIASDDRFKGLDPGDIKAAKSSYLDNYLSPPVEESIPGRILDAGIDVAKGVVRTGQGLVGMTNIAAFNIPGRALEAIRYDPEETIKILESGYSPARQKAQAEVQRTKGFWDTIGALVDNPSVALGTVLESAPMSLTGMGVARRVAGRLLGTALAKKGLKAGSKEALAYAQTFFKDPKVMSKVILAGAATEGAQEAGLMQESVRGQGKEWAESVPYSIAAGLGTAAIGTLTSKIPGLKDAEALVGTAGYGTRKGLWATGREIAKTMFKEGVLEELPQETQQQVWENLALGRPWDEGALKGGAMGMVAGAAQGGGAAIASSLMNKPEMPPPPDTQESDTILSTLDVALSSGDVTPGEVRESIPGLVESGIPREQIEALLEHHHKMMAQPEPEEIPSPIRTPEEQADDVIDEYAKAFEDVYGEILNPSRALPPGQGFIFYDVPERAPYSPELAAELRRSRQQQALPPGQGFIFYDVPERAPYSPELAAELRRSRQQQALPPGQGFELVETPSESRRKGIPEGDKMRLKEAGATQKEIALVESGKATVDDILAKKKPIPSLQEEEIVPPAASGEAVEGATENDYLWETITKVPPELLDKHKESTRKREIIIERGFPQPATLGDEPVTILGVAGKTGRRDEPLSEPTLESLKSKGGQLVIKMEDGSTAITLSDSLTLPELPKPQEGATRGEIKTSYQTRLDELKSKIGEMAYFDEGLRGLFEKQGQEAMEQYRNLHPEGAAVLYKKDSQHTKNMGAVISQSAKRPGKYQVTWFDESGFSGDSQHETEAKAFEEAYTDGYRIADPERGKIQLTSDQFIEGVENAQKAQKEHWERMTKGKAAKPKAAEETPAKAENLTEPAKTKELPGVKPPVEGGQSGVNLIIDGVIRTPEQFQYELYHAKQSFDKLSAQKKRAPQGGRTAELLAVKDAQERLDGLQNIWSKWAEQNEDLLSEYQERQKNLAGLTVGDAVNVHYYGDLEVTKVNDKTIRAKRASDGHEIEGTIPKTSIRIVRSTAAEPAKAKEPWEMTKGEFKKAKAETQKDYGAFLDAEEMEMDAIEGVTPDETGFHPNAKKASEIKKFLENRLPSWRLSDEGSDHEAHIRKALKEGRLSKEDYTRLHEKDYGPIAEFVPDLAKAEPQPAKPAEGTAALIEEDDATVTEVRGIAVRNLVDMLKESSGGGFREFNEGGGWEREFVSSTPDWFKGITVTTEKGNKRKVSKNELLAAAKNIEKGKRLTDKQQEMWNQVEEIANAEMRSDYYQNLINEIELAKTESEELAREEIDERAAIQAEAYLEDEIQGELAEEGIVEARQFQAFLDEWDSMTEEAKAYQKPTEPTLPPKGFKKTGLEQGNLITGKAEPIFEKLPEPERKKQIQTPMFENVLGQEVPMMERKKQPDLDKISESGVVYDHEETKAGNISDTRGGVADRASRAGRAVRPRVKYQRGGSYVVSSDHIRNSQEAAKIAQESIGQYADENLLAIVTDGNGKILKIHKSTAGQKDSASTNIEEYAALALNTKGAKKLWIVHNHPSGDATLSGPDIKIEYEINNLMRGNGIEAQIIATTPRAYKDKPNGTTHKLPYYERVFVNVGGKGPAITGTNAPQLMMDYIKNAGIERGIILIDNQNSPLGVVSVSNYMKFEGNQREILARIDDLNATTMVLVDTRRDLLYDEVANVKRFANAAKKRFLDVIDWSGSWYARGEMPYIDEKDTAFFRFPTEEESATKESMTAKKGKADIPTATTPKDEGGVKIGDRIRFIRYGRPTKNSTDWSKNERLKGMSVYSLDENGVAQQTIRSEFADRDIVYIGTGKVVGFGTDDEPLVTEYKIRKATKLEDEIAYYGKSRKEWLKEHGYDEKGNKIIPSPSRAPEEGAQKGKLSLSALEKSITVADLQKLATEVNTIFKRSLPTDVYHRVRIRLKPFIEIPADVNVQQSLEQWGADKTTKKPVGMTQFYKDFSALVELAYNVPSDTITGTAYHELFHVASSWLLPEKDRSRVLNYYKGNEENAAEAFKAFAQGAKAKQPDFITRIFARLNKILQRIKNALTGKGYFTPEDVFTKIMVGGYRGQSRDVMAGRMGGGKLEVGAWHGGPYAFDKFNTEKIGTGEGAQAFGWGLYFTDLEDIARNYAQYTSDKFIVYNGEKVNRSSFISNVTKEYGKEYEDAAFQIFWDLKSGSLHEDILKNIKTRYPEKYETAKYILDGIEHADANEGWTIRPKGGIRVENKMSKDERAALWDMQGSVGWYKKSTDPLSKIKKEAEKSVEVQKDWIRQIKSGKEWIGKLEEREKYLKEAQTKLNVIEKYNLEAKYNAGRNLYKVTLHKGKKPGDYTWLDWDKPLSDDQRTSILNELVMQSPRKLNAERYIRGEKDVDGKDVYNELSRIFGKDGELGDKEASLFLLRAGIDGIRYPSGTLSGIKDSDKYNYVVFDESAVTIEEHTRFRMMDQDAAYLDAVKRGDMETAQKMVDEAAQASGLPILDNDEQLSFSYRRKANPSKTVKAYKLFKMRDGKLYPMFVGAKSEVPTGMWLDAKGEDFFVLDNRGRKRVPALTGEWTTLADGRKMKTLAFRPGWHSGDMPYAIQIAPKNEVGEKSRYENDVWAEIEISADEDYTKEARSNASVTKKGKLNEREAQIDYIPEDGFYPYKTNSNAMGQWYISGSIKVNRILSEGEVNSILKNSGVTPMPWIGGKQDLGKFGIAAGEKTTRSKLLDPVTYDDQGNVIPLSQRFNPEVADIRFAMETTLAGTPESQALLKKLKALEKKGKIDPGRTLKALEKYESLVQTLKDDKKDIFAKQKALEDHIKEHLEGPDRYRVLSYIKNIAKPSTEKGRQTMLKKGIERVAAVHEKVEKQNAINGIKEILKKKQPRRDSKRGIVTGRQMTNEGHKVLEKIKKAFYTPEVKVENKIQSYADRWDRGTLTDEEREELIIMVKYGSPLTKSASELNAALEDLEALVSGERMKWQAEEEARKAEFGKNRTQLHEELSYGQEKKRPDQLAEERQNKGVFGKILDAARSFDDMSQSWEMLLDKLARYYKPSTALKSPITETYREKVFNATIGEHSSLAAHQELIRDKAREIYGHRGLARRLQKNTEIKKNTGVTRVYEGKRVELSLSQNMAYKLWQLFQQPSIQEEMNERGYDATTLSQVEKYLDPKVKEWARWQIEEFYPMYREGANEVYKKLFYIDMADIEGYSPVSRIYANETADDALLRDIGPMMSSILPSAVKARVKNARDFNILDGDSVLFKHIVQMEHFKAWGETMRELRSVFGVEPTQGIISQYHGATANRVVQDFLNRFARGGQDRALTLTALDKMRANFTRGVIGANPVVFLKQLTSIPAYAMEIPTHRFVSGTSYALSHPIKVYKTLMQSEAMKARYKVGWERDVVLAMQRASIKSLSHAQSFSDMMMLSTKLGDKLAIIAGGWSVYSYHLDKLKKQGMNHEDAHKKALYQFDIATKRAQQAGDVMDMAYLQEHGGSLGKWFTMFMTAPLAYYRNSAAALRNMIAGRKGEYTGQNLKRFVTSWALLQMMFQFVASGFEWDDKEMLRAALIGPLNGLFVIRDITETLGMALIEGERPWQSIGVPPPLSTFTGPMAKAALRAHKNTMEDEWDLEEFLKFADDFSKAMGQITGVPIGNITRVAKGIKAVAEGDTEKPVRRAMGYSAYALNERGK